MDPAVRAANELNAIFSRLEVPCEVCVTSEAGKHVRATADLDKDFTLVEELPIVSWPSALLLSLRQPFCFHCLRLATHELPPSDGAAADAANALRPPSTLPTASALPEKWTCCAHCVSCFCSVDCQQASARLHRLLCPLLPKLRSACNSSSAAVNSGISVEALARCVSWVVQRLSLVIEQQKLTHEVLQADFNEQRNSSATADNDSGVSAEVLVQTTWSQNSLNSQLFTQVVAPFSRLISPPDSVQFNGVSLPAWISSVRSLLAESCVKILLVASGAPLGNLQLHPLHFDGESKDSSSSTSQSSSPRYWAEALVQTLFSTDTLRTLVGQMVLNAHGVNDYYFPACAAGVAPPSATGRFEWFLKGAGLYALLSSFNHSCEPNAEVLNADGTNEVVLKTTRPVRMGEEITITYIPLTASTTLAERRELLKNYFFTCHCPRCV
ncbi:hypothetical protein ABL78_3005 [Leptomonas seymouri]|uniref:SET domain-containing protein n=1 Tax=Leptomonas seymouri TaxID=5684 RepID=A0A0N1IL96_LEPSE|nr:hypothetical protein ABL78_3005 [Leptomonas seymouri]|eukprot:KPI87895.1 hypothetical protein ABL78_3005 [Leptomonas seymouri]